MKIPLWPAAAFFFSLSLTQPAIATDYTLYHRISSPFSSSSSSSPSAEHQWTPRARLSLSASPATQTDATPNPLETELPFTTSTGTARLVWTDVTPAPTWDAIKHAARQGGSKHMYQLALRRGAPPGTEHEGQNEAEREEVRTFVPLCHLRQSSPNLASLFDTLTLHLRNSTSALDPTPSILSFTYSIQDIVLGPDGCPLQHERKVLQLDESTRRERANRAAGRARLKRLGKPLPPPLEDRAPPRAATALVVAGKMQAVAPVLRAPLPTMEDGSVKPPEVEKSFLQKYWVYIVPVVILLVMPAGGEEDKGATRETQAASQGRGARQIR